MVIAVACFPHVASPEILPSELYLNSRCATVWSACSSTPHSSPYTRQILHIVFISPTNAFYVIYGDLHIQTFQTVIHSVVARLNNESGAKAWQPATVDGS
jgi:hypothetical protein